MRPAHAVAPIRGLTPPARLLLAIATLALLATGEACAQSSSRIPPEDVLRPLMTPSRPQTANQQDAQPADESPRSRIAIRAQSQPEKLTWQFDDAASKPARTKMNPLRSADVASQPRLSAKSSVPARTAGYQYPVRQAGGQEPLQLQPATDVVEEPTPVEVPQGEIIEESPPSPSAVPSRPRSFTSIYQPKKADGAKAEPAPDFKCPSREELMKSICELTVDIAPSKGEVPKECPLFADGCEPRLWCDSLYLWKASCLCHKPLYFEQMALERYGHTCHPFLQPVISGAHFFGTLPILPYKMGVEEPGECVYALGYCRPGDCAPKMLYPLPLSIRGAVYEAAAVTGLVFLIP
jgi:hypothetical protein